MAIEINTTTCSIYDDGTGSGYEQASSILFSGATTLTYAATEANSLVGLTAIASTDDGRLLRAYQLNIGDDQVIHSALLPISVTSITGTASRIRLFMYHADNPPKLSTSTEIKDPWEVHEPAWPGLGADLLEMYATVVDGETTYVDISPLLADLFDKTNWTSGNRFVICIAMHPDDLTGTDKIVIDKDVNDMEVTHSTYSRAHQTHALGDTTLLHFWPFDAGDADVGGGSFRAIRERRDEQRNVSLGNFTLDLSTDGYVVSAIDYSTGFDHTARFDGIKINDGEYFVEFEPSGTWDTIAEAVFSCEGTLSLPDNQPRNATNAHVFDTIENSYAFIQSWVYSESSNCHLGSEFRFDNIFDAAPGYHYHWIEHNASTGEITLTTSGSIPSLDSDTVTDLQYALADGDIVEYCYMYNRLETKGHAEIRIRKAGTGTYLVIELETGTLTPTDALEQNNPVIILSRLVGYRYTDHPQFGSIWIHTPDDSVTWEVLKESAHWVQGQWQAGYKVLPHQLMAARPSTGGGDSSVPMIDVLVSGLVDDDLIEEII